MPRALRALSAAVAVVALVCAGGGCSDRVLPSPTTLVGPTGLSPISTARLPWDGHALASPVVLDRRLAVVGISGNVEARRASVLAWLLVTGELAGRVKPELTVAFSGTKSTRVVPIATTVAPLEWRLGDVVVVSGSVDVPPGAKAGPVTVGISDAGRPWPVTRGPKDALRLGELVVADSADNADNADSAHSADSTNTNIGDEDAHAARRAGPIVIDGHLDEPDWQRAPMRLLVPYRAGSPVTLGSTVRFLWDDDAVYVAFDVDDDDAFSPYTKRDDPLYESEALELFIDADGDADEYVELQSNVGDVHFDAAFAGGPRQNMRVAYDHPFETRTATRPGGYGMEWRIPVAGLVDVASTTIVAGSFWRIQAFRLERRRDAGGTVRATEASSLWPIERNDFHALDRMGRLRFDAPAPPAPFLAPPGSSP